MVRHDRPGRFQQHELDVFVFARVLNAAEIAAVNVPEPATMALLGLAATGLGGYIRRRKTA